MASSALQKCKQHPRPVVRPGLGHDVHAYAWPVASVDIRWPGVPPCPHHTNPSTPRQQYVRTPLHGSSHNAHGPHGHILPPLPTNSPHLLSLCIDRISLQLQHVGNCRSSVPSRNQGFARAWSPRLMISQASSTPASPLGPVRSNYSATARQGNGRAAGQKLAGQRQCRPRMHACTHADRPALHYFSFFGSNIRCFWSLPLGPFSFAGMLQLHMHARAADLISPLHLSFTLLR